MIPFYIQTHYTFAFYGLMKTGENIIIS